MGILIRRGLRQAIETGAGFRNSGKNSILFGERCSQPLGGHGPIAFGDPALQQIEVGGLAGAEPAADPARAAEAVAGRRREIEHQSEIAADRQLDGDAEDALRLVEPGEGLAAYLQGGVAPGEILLGLGESEAVAAERRERAHPISAMNGGSSIEATPSASRSSQRFDRASK